MKVALYPTKPYDRNGIFSGSALEKDGKLYLYYSAVRYLEEEEENIHHAKNENFVTSQAMLISEDGFSFDNKNAKKQIIPVLQDEKIGHGTHTRDPKVWKYQNSYYMILGSTISGTKGRVLFYKSQDGTEWEYITQYTHKNFGSILECPDLFEVQGQYVFQGSPMNILEDGLEYAHNAICALAEFQEGKCELSMPDTYRFIDYGLDLYAPQTNVDKDGNRVMMAWMRMPKPVEGVGERSTWNGMMCTPRVIEIEKGHIFYKIHPQTDRYLSREVTDRRKLDWSRPFRIKTTLKEGENIDVGGYQITIEEDCVKGDRTQVFDSLSGFRRTAKTPKLGGRYDLDIIVDENLIEIFVNEGQYVLSHVVYDLKKQLTGSIGKLLTGEEKGYEKKR